MTVQYLVFFWFTQFSISDNSPNCHYAYWWRLLWKTPIEDQDITNAENISFSDSVKIASA